MTCVGRRDLEVYPLCLGGNVFGWTLDQVKSSAVLDAYVGAGGNFIDTADSYSAWAPGNAGGESETIIGEWMARRGNRDELVVATKVGAWQEHQGLSAHSIREGALASLSRLRTDRIDLYYAHRDDPHTPLAETLGAFDALVREGKVRYVGASNYSAPRLAEALACSRREGLVSYVALQPLYNLLDRDYEGELRDLCAESDIACVPYYGLASGFLTGKYRPGGPAVDSPRAERVGGQYANERGWRVLGELDAIAAEHGVAVAGVALAWLRMQPTVVAPIASARSPQQLAELLVGVELQLDDDELARLERAAG